jgi:hypothetical protein
MPSEKSIETMLPNRVRPTRGLTEIYSGIPFTQHGKDMAKEGELMN